MASKHKLDFVDSEIGRIKRDNLYRKLRYGKARGAHITINGRKLLNLCSNDYLGIPPTRTSNIQSQSSSRLVSGNDESYKRLEKVLARHKSQQNSLVYPTGYMANLGVISAVAKKGDIVFSDELNHASIIEACRLSDAKIVIYRHNDISDLEDKIRQKARNKFVVTEGIFSMDGDFSPLKQIADLSERHNAVTIVDDAHGDFVVGKDGKGTPSHFNVSKKIDVYISSLSKGLGSFGGYIASKNNVIDLCINRSRPFIYTSALPSFLVEYSLKRIASNRERQRKRLEKNTKQLSRGLRGMGFDIKSPSHIIPIIIGSEKTAMDFGEYLFEKGLFAQPIRYPTVAKDQARLRLSVTAWLTERHINDALGVFDNAHKKFM